MCARREPDASAAGGAEDPSSGIRGRFSPEIPASFGACVRDSRRRPPRVDGPDLPTMPPRVHKPWPLSTGPRPHSLCDRLRVNRASPGRDPRLHIVQRYRLGSPAVPGLLLLSQDPLSKVRTCLAEEMFHVTRHGVAVASRIGSRLPTQATFAPTSLG